MACRVTPWPRSFEAQAQVTDAVHAGAGSWVTTTTPPCVSRPSPCHSRAINRGQQGSIEAAPVPAEQGSGTLAARRCTVPKLTVRVRFPSPAPQRNARSEGYAPPGVHLQGSLDSYRRAIAWHAKHSIAHAGCWLVMVIRKRYCFHMTRTIELPDELAAALKEVATAEHRSVQQTLVLAAQEYVERHKLRARVRESGRRIVEQDRELLDRLAQ